MKRVDLTLADIQAAYDNPGWLGYGYLGERGRGLATQPERAAAADAYILRVANEARWTPAQFFDWLNSKNGRWYAETWFHMDGEPGQAAFDRDMAQTARLPK